jgi:RHS repeat-associated protein
MYDPYGSVSVKAANWNSSSDSKEWNYTFQGGRYDAYTGLLSFQHRDDDPNLGRWIQQDPAGYVDGKDLYRALTDSPVDFVDPLGLQTQPAGGGLPTPHPAGLNAYSNVAADIGAAAPPTTNPSTRPTLGADPVLGAWSKGLNDGSYANRQATQKQIEEALASDPAASKKVQDLHDLPGGSPEETGRLEDALQNIHVRLEPTGSITLKIGAKRIAKVYVYVPPALSKEGNYSLEPNITGEPRGAINIQPGHKDLGAAATGVYDFVVTGQDVGNAELTFTLKWAPANNNNIQPKTVFAPPDPPFNTDSLDICVQK